MTNSKDTANKHTPGPWEIIRDHEDDRDIFGKNELLATAYDMNGPDPKSVAIANARLIAAAPELLETCEAAFAELTGLEGYLTTCEQTVILANIDTLAAKMNIVRSQLAAAIRKAKGEEISAVIKKGKGL